MQVHNITLNITSELFEKMKKYPEVNWSAVARISIKKYIERREKE